MNLASDKRLATELLGAAVDVVEQQRQIINEQRQLTNELLTVLRAVYDETRGEIIPYSTDSYLPAHILERVAAAIARATPAARSSSNG